MHVELVVRNDIGVLKIRQIILLIKLFARLLLVLLDGLLVACHEVVHERLLVHTSTCNSFQNRGSLPEGFNRFTMLIDLVTAHECCFE